MSVHVAPIACRELVELVTDYLEGALPPEQHARFDNHIAGCDGCTTYLEQMRETIRLTGTLREQQISSGALAALLHAFRDWAST
ncbi:MAG TPA: zf-HC2 domain-containing protein [Gaiellales bacterium]|nr:zf-HC2 domain-containing protein [Gaiellales bacterium]